MSSETEDKKFKSFIGRHLYEMLPEIYRTRDNAEQDRLGDLAKYLDACGEQLDLIRNTLDQLFADSFPDQLEMEENQPEKNNGDIENQDKKGEEESRDCQSWLLPYLAQLLDVRLVSPQVEGRRKEVANAVTWRQRKGTLPVMENIAEAVAQTDVEIHEGWKRIAVTPRIGMPLLPYKPNVTVIPCIDMPLRKYYMSDHTNNGDDIKSQIPPNIMARHPGLPAVTIDFRYPSRAVKVGAEGEEIPLDPDIKSMTFSGKEVWWQQANPHGVPCFPESYEDVSRRTVDLRTPTWQQGYFHPKRLLLFVPPPTGFFEPGRFTKENKKKNLNLTEDKDHYYNNVWFQGTLSVTAGRLKLEDCVVEELVVESSITTKDEEEPLLDAKNCLIKTGQVKKGLARLEYCTILGDFKYDRIQASDCIFCGLLSPLNQEERDLAKEPNCVRYSRISPETDLSELLEYPSVIESNTTESPVFWKFEYIRNGKMIHRQPGFGQKGCAVLHPATPESIRFGAEDGGEMGVYHNRYYCLMMAAVLDKLRDFLPLGIEPVLIPDVRLSYAPTILV